MEMKLEDSGIQIEGPTILLPGDPVPDLPSAEAKRVIVLGPGLRREAAGDETSKIVASKPGILRRKESKENPNQIVIWVDTHSKRYSAARNENVIGVVIAKAGDIFRVDIGAAEPASLSYLAFEGATKKNRPNVNVGDVIYAKLLVASRDMEPELVCVDSYGKKAGLGPLSGGGFTFNVPLHLVRKLLNPECVLLKHLGKNIPFEIAIGMNGRIWIRGRVVKETISIANAISVAEYMDNNEIIAMINKVVDALSGF